MRKHELLCEAFVANLCLVQGLQPLLVVLLYIFQLLQSLFLLLQGLHVNLLTLHLREELIHRLRQSIMENLQLFFLQNELNSLFFPT